MVPPPRFTTSKESAFYQRQRKYSEKVKKLKVYPYQVDKSTVCITDGKLSGTILKSTENADDNQELLLDITFLKSGVVRFSVDEKNRQGNNNNGLLNTQRYNEAAKWTVVGGLDVDDNVEYTISETHTAVEYGPSKKYCMKLNHSTLEIEFRRDGNTHVIINKGGCFNMEHWVESCDDSPVESIFRDTEPKGPESIGLDISFEAYKHVYGIPEHTTSLDLKPTRGNEADCDGKYTEPYRLYNVDCVEYLCDTQTAMYGSIPFIQAHKSGSDAGVFWLNASDTWVDIIKDSENTDTHWISEAGIMDLFVFLGPDSKTLYKDFGELVGYTALPQYFALGYHQCRWNYNSEDDVAEVDGKFDEHGIPYDVIWLDIEYTDGRRYFTWDPKMFSTPEKMLEHLNDKNRKLVVIIDPHFKVDDNYWVFNEIIKKDLVLKDRNGNVYKGTSHPGEAVWLDGFNPESKEWWKSLFHSPKFIGFKDNLYVWNDMNEPSIAEGPETVASKDAIHYGNWENRSVHNMYGLRFHENTANAIMQRASGKLDRPFVLSRSFWAGSQRTAAVWTGDCHVTWDFLKYSIPMLLTLGISGLTFAGTDIPGFVGEPSDELSVRWYQAGIFYPFLRAHACIGTRRREPYLYKEPYRTIIKNAIRFRYSHLPLFYTSIRRSSIDGMPILRPQYVHFPHDEQGFSIEDQFYLGDSGLLVKPVTKEGASVTEVYISDNNVYYDYFTFESVIGNGGMVTIDTPLDKILVLFQEGNIISRKDVLRPSSASMEQDPYTLVVSVGLSGSAKGELYIDDGSSYSYKEGEFIHRELEFSTEDKILSSVDLHSEGASSIRKAKEDVLVEKVIIIGYNANVDVKVIQRGHSWNVRACHSKVNGTSVTTILEPKVRIVENWTIEFP